jgi:3-oxoadipate enol-lactonase
VTLVDAFADFVGGVDHREVTLPWGETGVWEVGEGRPVVLLHGIAGSRRVFFRLVPLLARTRRVIVPLLRGEDIACPRVTLEGLLDDLAALLRALDLTETTLLGVSFGGALALAYGERRDPRVEDIVVQGAFATFRLRWTDRIALALSRLAPDALGARYFGWRVLRGPECRLLREHAPGLDVLVADWSAKTPFPTLRSRTHLIGRMDLDAAVRAIEVPLTVAQGEADRVVPRLYFEHLSRLRPDATRVLWPGVGHLAALSHPDAVAALAG